MWDRLQRLFRERSRSEVEAPGASPRSEAVVSDVFRLSVDDGGEYVVALGATLVLGHLRGGHADLPFLADVDDRHAELSLVESLSGGRRWQVRPLGAGAVEVERAAVAGPRLLEDDDGALLGGNLAFRFRRPDPSSSSAVLELQRGIECFGATNVLLFDEGLAGRVRLGPLRSSHVRVASFSLELQAVRAEGRLQLSRFDLEGNRLSRQGLELELPLMERVPISVPRGDGSGRAPLLVTLSPVRDAGIRGSES